MLVFLSLVPSTPPVLAADQAARAPSAEEAIIWRNSLMTMFFKDISQDGMDKIDLYSKADAEFCRGWFGLTCRKDEVTEVRYYGVKGGNFNVRALPNSVRALRITQCAQTFEISTRSFPKNLRLVVFTLNKITGRIDLTSLPDTLETAEFHFNKLTGPISLEQLPPQLKELDLRGNSKIRQNTVYYDNLPKNIQKLHLVYDWEKKRIKEVRAVNPDNAVQNSDLFQEMPRERIH